MNADWSEIKISTSLSNSLLEYPPREGGIAGDTIIPDEKSRNKAMLLLRQNIYIYIYIYIACKRSKSILFFENQDPKYFLSTPFYK